MALEEILTQLEALGGQAPSGAGSHKVVRGHPPLAKRLLVEIILNDISGEPAIASAGAFRRWLRNAEECFRQRKAFRPCRVPARRRPPVPDTVSRQRRSRPRGRDRTLYSTACKAVHGHS